MNTQIKVFNIIACLSAFFIPFGSGIELVFSSSKLFIIFAGLLILNWLIVEKNKFVAYNNYFNLFLIFVAMHTLITYTVYVPEEFELFSTTYSRTSDAPHGIMVLRFLFFVLYGYALSAHIKNPVQISQIAKSFGLGLIFAIYFGDAGVMSGVSWVRQIGGFSDPNHFGLTAVAAILLSGYSLNIDSTLYSKVINLMILASGIFGTVTSGSRGAILALVVAILFLICRVSNIRMVSKIIFLSVLFAIITNFMLPDSYKEMLAARVSYERVSEDKGSERLDIWEEYLSNLWDYSLLGTGLHRSPEVIKGSSSFQGVFTHNDYLASFAEFGVFGFLLFVLGLIKMGMGFFNKEKDTQIKVADALILSLYVSWIMCCFFVNTFNLRTTWLILGIVSAYKQIRKKNHCMVSKSTKIQGGGVGYSYK